MGSRRLSRAWRIRGRGQASRSCSTTASIRSDQISARSRLVSCSAIPYPTVLLADEHLPSEALIEAAPAGGLVLCRYCEDDAIAAPQTEPCDCVLEEPHADTSIAPRFSDVHLGQFR